MGRAVQQNHTDPRSPSLGAGRGSRDVHCRALPQVFYQRGGDIANGPRVPSFIERLNADRAAGAVFVSVTLKGRYGRVRFPCRFIDFRVPFHGVVNADS